MDNVGGNEPKETQEFIEKGKLAESVYMEYWKTGASTILLASLVFLFIVAQLACNSCDLWVRYWYVFSDFMTTIA